MCAARRTPCTPVSGEMAQKAIERASLAAASHKDSIRLAASS